MKVFLGAFGDAGHAFPMLALGTALVARGHEVHFETWKRWRPHAEAAGIHFADAPEYQVFPTPSTKHLKPYAAAVKAARETGEMVAKIAPGRGGRRHHDPGGVAGRRVGRRARGDAGAARVPAHGARLPDLLDRRAAAAHEARRAHVDRA